MLHERDGWMGYMLKMFWRLYVGGHINKADRARFWHLLLPDGLDSKATANLPRRITAPDHCPVLRPAILLESPLELWHRCKKFFHVVMADLGLWKDCVCFFPPEWSKWQDRKMLVLAWLSKETNGNVHIVKQRLAYPQWMFYQLLWMRVPWSHSRPSVQ